LTLLEITSYRVKQFGNYTLGFIPNLRVLTFRERQVNYLNKLY